MPTNDQTVDATGGWLLIVLGMCWPSTGWGAEPAQTAQAIGPCSVAINAAGTAQVTVTNNCDPQGAATAKTVQKLIDKSRAVEANVRSQTQRVDKIAGEQADLVVLVRDLTRVVDGLVAKASQANAPAAVQTSLAQLEKGDVHAAIAFLGQEADGAGVRAADLYRQQAALLRAVDVASSLEALQRSLTVEPDDFETLRKASWLAIVTGDTQLARRFRTHMLEVATKQVERDPNDRFWKRDLLISEVELADVELRQGNIVEAGRLYGKVLKSSSGDFFANPTDKTLRDDMALYLTRGGDVLRAAGRLDDAVDAYKWAMSVAVELAQGYSDDPPTEAVRRVAAAAEGLGDTYSLLGKRAEAQQVYEGLGITVRNQLARQPENVELQRDLSLVEERLGVMKLANDPVGALAHFRACMAIREQLVAIDSHNLQWQGDLALGQSRIAQAQALTGDARGAIRSNESALETLRKLAALDKNNAKLQTDIAYTLYHRTAVRGFERTSEQKRQDLEEVIAILSQLKSQGRLLAGSVSVLNSAQRDLETLKHAGLVVPKSVVTGH